MRDSEATHKLETAYFDILRETHYSKISVTDIIRRADVSRTTFYRHYTDIFDMHKKIADKLAFSIIEECAKIVTAPDTEDYFSEILKIFNTQEKYVLLLSGENGSRYFFEAMLLKAKELFSCSQLIFTEDQLFRLRFITVAMVGVYVRDILEGREHNPGYIEICKKLIGSVSLSGGFYESRY